MVAMMEPTFKLAVPLLFLGLPLLGVLALVLGIVSLVRINRSAGRLRGRGLAIAAIVVGALVLLAAPLILGAGYFLVGGRASAPVRIESSVSRIHAPIDSVKPLPGESVTVTNDTGTPR
jgi:hypothetical protein